MATSWARNRGSVHALEHPQVTARVGDGDGHGDAELVGGTTGNGDEPGRSLAADGRIPDGGGDRHAGLLLDTLIASPMRVSGAPGSRRCGL
jgi:hypothetical protein